MAPFASPKRIIVLTGASGYLGQHLLHSLLTNPAAPDQVHYHIYALYGSTHGFPEAVKTIRHSDRTTVDVEPLDLTSEQDLEQWFSSHKDEKIDVCIHTAAWSNPRTCQSDPEKARQINVPTVFFQGLKKASNKPLSVIALSTDQVYDGKNAPYTEQVELGPSNVYGETKLEMEGFLLGNKFCNGNDVVVTVLRSSIMLGSKAPILPDQAHETFLHFIAGRQNIETTFYVDERRSVVAVKDMVAVIRWLVEQQTQQQAANGSCSSHHGVFNMGGPASVSRHDMAVEVFKHMGYDQKHIKAERKGHQPQAAVPSPLDIGMDSSKIVSLTGLSFDGLEEIVKTTFAETTSSEAASGS